VSAGTSHPPAVHVVLGDEELLVERAVRDTLAAARRVDPAVDLTRLKAADLTAPYLLEMISSTLFSEGRVVVLEAAQSVSEEIGKAILDYAKAPSDGVVLVVLHSNSGGTKAGKALPAALRKAGAQITECAKITKPAEREAFVKAEIRRAGGKIDAAAVTALIDAVGSDLRELAMAASQLVADTGGTVTEEAVRRYHRGKAEVNGFAVAGKVVSGDRAAALESLPGALQIGVPHVLIADAIADAVRTIARVSAAGRGNPYSMAGELGMPPWKIRRAQSQARGWSREALAESMAIVARLNADVKGAAADPEYALERAALEIAAARSNR